MKDIENLVDNILSKVKMILLQELSNDVELEETDSSEDLLEESMNDSYATVDDCEDFTPLDISDKLR